MEARWWLGAELNVLERVYCNEQNVWTKKSTKKTAKTTALALALESPGVRPSAKLISEEATAEQYRRIDSKGLAPFSYTFHHPMCAHSHTGSIGD